MVCDNHDYLNHEDIEDLYEDDIVCEEELEELQPFWEYDYHNLAQELVDD
jgi:hypothetical protein